MPENPYIDLSEFNSIHMIHFRKKENGLFMVKIQGHDKVGILHTEELDDLPPEQKNSLVTIALNLYLRRN